MSVHTCHAHCGRTHLATGRRFRAIALTQAMSYAVDKDGEETARAFARRAVAAVTGPIVAKLRKAWAPLV